MFPYLSFTPSLSRARNR